LFLFLYPKPAAYGINSSGFFYWALQGLNCIAIKNAMSIKIDKVVMNALEVHCIKKQESAIPTHFGQALLNFTEMAPQCESVGSFCWTCQMIFLWDMCCREGLYSVAGFSQSTLRSLLWLPLS
jgi:hypothetical protein